MAIHSHGPNDAADSLCHQQQLCTPTSRHVGFRSRAPRAFLRVGAPSGPLANERGVDHEDFAIGRNALDRPGCAPGGPPPQRRSLSSRSGLRTSAAGPASAEFGQDSVLRCGSVVLGDLSQLWELPLSGCALAAVQDAAIPFCDSPRGVKNRSRFGIPENAPYFNAGVMCIQLDEWRRRDITKRAFAYLQQAGGSADFLHQEALNAVLWNDWLPLDPCWNVPGSLAGRFQTPAASNCDHPAIVHFAGRFKPWRAAVGGSFYPQYRAFLSSATKFVPQIQPTLADKLLSFYDRRLRDSLYACERALWNRRLI